WVALPDLTEHTIDVPRHVHIVPGDVAAGRVPDPAVRSGRAYQRAQQRERDAARALREGRAAEAKAIYESLGDDVSRACEAAPAALRADLAEDAWFAAEMAERALVDDARRLAKATEEDRWRKSGRRGRRPGA